MKFDRLIGTFVLTTALAACSAKPEVITMPDPTPTKTLTPEATKKPTTIEAQIGMLDVNGKPLYQKYNVFHRSSLDKGGKENFMTTLPHGEKVKVIGISGLSAICITWEIDDPKSQDKILIAAWADGSELLDYNNLNLRSVAELKEMGDRDCFAINGNDVFYSTDQYSSIDK